MDKKVNTHQLDFFEPGASFPVTDNGGGGLSNHPLNNKKIAFDPAILLMQLKDRAPNTRIKVKTSAKLVTAVNIREDDKAITVTINPHKWRGEKKVARLEEWVYKTVAEDSS